MKIYSYRVLCALYLNCSVEAASCTVEILSLTCVGSIIIGLGIVLAIDSESKSFGIGNLILSNYYHYFVYR